MDALTVTHNLAAREVFRIGKRIALGDWIVLGQIQVTGDVEDPEREFLGVILKTSPMNAQLSHLRAFPISQPMPKPVWNPFEPVAITALDEYGDEPEEVD